MKKAILFFSIFLISLMIGCSVETPVAVSTNPGGEDLTGLGEQYAYIIRMKISQVKDDGSGEKVVLVNHYSKFKEMIGVAWESEMISFTLDNTVNDIEIEETAIWAIPNHGYTNTIEARFAVYENNSVMINDSLNIPDIPINSSGFRKEKRSHSTSNFNLGNEQSIKVAVGSHLNNTPVRTKLKLDIFDDDENYIESIFDYTQYFEAINSSSGATWGDMQYFHTKKDAKPLNYTIVLDQSQSVFQVSKFYCLRPIYPNPLVDRLFFSHYTSYIYFYDFDDNGNQIGDPKIQSFDLFHRILVDGGDDWQGYSINSLPSTVVLNPEKLYGIRMKLVKSE